MSSPIPVTIVTGFLGAGKSTLLERWLGELGAEVAVIVNEWGEIGIDGDLLRGSQASSDADRTARLLEISGGCLCCTSQDEMVRALATLAEMTPRPARVLVETSGAASPAGVLRALRQESARGRMRLDGVVTVVDGTRLADVLTFDLAVEQLGFADVVVVSHADEIADVSVVHRELEARAPAAFIARSARGAVRDVVGELTLTELLDRREGALHIPSTTSPVHEAIDSVALRHDGEIDEERFLTWVTERLAEVEARILRIKGIVAVAGVDHRVVLQGVGEAIEVTAGAPWGEGPRTSRLVILGLGLEDEGLEASFAATLVV